VNRVKTLDFDETSSLDAVWRAYRSERSQGSKSALGTPWEPTYLGRATYLRVAVVFIDCGAGVGQRIYIDQYTDTSGLNYFQNRYYDNARGQFVTQDPVFWEIGLTTDGRAVLPSPQALNSYSYANGNPILNKDPNGRCGPICVGLLALVAPDIAGDPVFNANGTISSTPQQVEMSTLTFAGLMLTNSEESKVLSELRAGNSSSLMETIGMSNPLDEVTSLPTRIPTGGAAIIVGTLVGINWLVGGANGWGDNPTNLAWLKALYNSKKILGDNQNKTINAGDIPRVTVSTGVPASYSSSGSSNISPLSGVSGLPPIIAAAASAGYGSSGSSYTTFFAANAFSACGTLCR
jgi:RHS repeat-associated protein